MPISTPFLIAIILFVIIIIALVVLYFLGKRMQKRQEEQDAQVQSHAQPVTMLIIDKRRLRLSKSGLPEVVVNQTPWYAKLSKVPIVKAKIGPQVATLICDPAIYNELPLKKEVKAMLSGLYISSFKNLHGKNVIPPKKGFMHRLRRLAGQA